MPTEDVQLDPRAVAVVKKANLLDRLVADPKTKMATLRAVRTVEPDLPLPELDTEERVNQAVEAATKDSNARVAALEKRLSDRDAADTDEALKSQGYTDEDVVEIKKIQKEKGITDLNTAAEHFSLVRRVAAPRQAPTPIQLPNMKGLFENPKAWARKEAYAVADELERARR